MSVTNLIILLTSQTLKKDENGPRERKSQKRNHKNAHFHRNK